MPNADEKRERERENNENSDLVVRTFILVGVIEFLLKSTIDHADKTILSGSRVRDIGQNGGDIDLHRWPGVNDGDGSDEYNEITNEEESTDSSHFRCFSEWKKKWKKMEKLAEA